MPGTGARNTSRWSIRRLTQRIWRSDPARIATLIFLSAAVLVGLWRFTRSTPTRRLRVIDLADQSTTTSDITVRTLELHTGMTVVGGNEVRLMMNGALYPSLWRDLRSARRTIAIQNYFAMPGALADSLKDILIDRARSGVRVLVLLDAFGSQDLPRQWRIDLENGGVNVAVLRGLEWSTLHNAANRSHVRAIVIDGGIGYTGGFGFADYWMGTGRRSGEWRESNVRFEGPAVAQLQAAFAAGWAEATGELLVGDAFFPPPADAGRVEAAVFFARPNLGSTPAERFLMLMIRGARRRLYITNSYFVPNQDFRNALELAAARGVDVRVLTAGPTTDVKTTRLAGRYHYDELLAAGIRIFEYSPSMMHAKALVTDGDWTAIGSMNFDNRSLAYNDELSLVVVDTVVGAQMDSLFRDDLTQSMEITRQEFDRRPWSSRMLELGAVLLSRVL